AICGELVFERCQFLAQHIPARVDDARGCGLQLVGMTRIDLTETEERDVHPDDVHHVNLHHSCHSYKSCTTARAPKYSFCATSPPLSTRPSCSVEMPKLKWRRVAYLLSISSASRKLSASRCRPCSETAMYWVCTTLPKS